MVRLRPSGKLQAGKNQPGLGVGKNAATPQTEAHRQAPTSSGAQENTFLVMDPHISP